MKQYLPVLTSCPLFSGLTEEDILSVLHCVHASVLEKPAGDFLFHAGDPIHSMGLVLSGSLLIIQEDLWGNRNIMTKLGAGDFFGESFAAAKNGISNVSAVVSENCRVLLLSLRELLWICPNACDHHNLLIRNLVSVFAGKVRLLNDKITHMSKRSTREKLLSFLSAEAMRQGSLDFDIPYDRQQLADFLCVERAAMSAELSKLQKEGSLRTNRSHFELHISKEMN